MRMLAWSRRCTWLCTTLLAARADTKARARLLSTPLHTACGPGPAPPPSERSYRRWGRKEREKRGEVWPASRLVEVLQLLLDAKASVNATQREGSTQLHLAVQKLAFSPLAKLLLERGADPSARDAAGYTALRRHAETCCDEDNGKAGVALAEVLVMHGADALEIDAGGRTLLHSATSRPELTAWLVGRCVSVNAATTALRETPLHAAARDVEDRSWCEFDVPGRVVLVLVGRGADVNTANRNGDTPLHLAARELNESVARALIEKGADTRLLSRLRITACGVARLKAADSALPDGDHLDRRWHEHVEFLKEHTYGTDPPENISSEEGQFNEFILERTVELKNKWQSGSREPDDQLQLLSEAFAVHVLGPRLAVQQAKPAAKAAWPKKRKQRVQSDSEDAVVEGEEEAEAAAAEEEEERTQARTRPGRRAASQKKAYALQDDSDSEGASELPEESESDFEPQV